MPALRVYQLLIGNLVLSLLLGQDLAGPDALLRDRPGVHAGRHRQTGTDFHRQSSMYPWREGNPRPDERDWRLPFDRAAHEELDRWSGGPYGIGKRMDINLTRAMVHAALTGALANVQYDENEIFHVLVPRTCPDAPSEILNPRNTWQDVAAYDARASKLASEFAAHFDKAYGNKGIDEAIVRQCPGK